MGAVMTVVSEQTPDLAGNAVASPEGDHDQVDLVVAHWLREDPDIDVVAKSTVARLRRLANHLERELRRDLLPLEIEMWELEVLLTLRRAPEHQLSAGALLRYCQVTSGAISNRLARLEARGWVRRDICPTDRRQVLVTLTPDGETRATALVATKTETEQRMLANIDRDTLERLSTDLRTLLLSIEGPAGDDLTSEQLLAACAPPTAPS
jgi:DNA-binding MarR family transcriptional regulator